MRSVFLIDRSFIAVIVLLAFLVGALTLRSRAIKRQRTREERRKARLAYRTWLASGNMLPPELQDRQDPR